MNKKAITAIIIVLVIVVFGIVWYASTHRKPAPPTGNGITQESGNNTQITPLEVKKTEVPTSKLPDGFPSDIPLEKGAQITQNYNAQASGVSQATRVWVTAKSLDENFNFYQDFFSKNGWKVQASTNDQNLKSITASKGTVQAIVNISQNTVNQQKTVSITATWQS